MPAKGGASRRVQRLEDELNRARYDEHGLGHFGVEAAGGIVVPLIFRGATHGVLLALDRLRDGLAFSAEDAVGARVLFDVAQAQGHRLVDQHPEHAAPPRQRADPEHPPMKTFPGVPILIDGEAFGNLYLTEKAGGADFSEADEQAVVILAEYAAVAIDHARRYAGISERRDGRAGWIGLSVVLPISEQLAVLPLSTLGLCGELSWPGQACGFFGTAPHGEANPQGGALFWSGADLQLAVEELGPLAYAE